MGTPCSQLDQLRERKKETDNIGQKLDNKTGFSLRVVAKKPRTLIRIMNNYIILDEMYSKTNGVLIQSVMVN